MTFYLAWFSFAVLLHRVLRMWHPDPWHNRINMILIPTSCNFFSGSWSPKNSEVKRACSEKFGDGWPTGKFFPGAHEWGQSVQKRHVLICEGSLCPRKLSDVSGPDLGEAGRYSGHGYSNRFLTLTVESVSTRKYRCTTSSGSIQVIVFSTRNGCVTVF